MKKLLGILLVALAVLTIAAGGCRKEAKWEGIKVMQDTELDKDIKDLDSVEQDLNSSELDNLENDIDEINW